MLGTPPPRRFTLLALALLTACAAGGSPDSIAGNGDAGVAAAAPAAAGPSRSGAFGFFLAGRLAISDSDTRYAADSLLAALRLEPDQPEILQPAFIATVLDGRADAVRLARRLPENPVAQLLIAGADAQAGRWERAEQRFRALPRQGAAQLLQPLLIAWAQQGRNQTDAALATLRPLMDSGRLAGLYALHAALIADVANRPRDAERHIRLALTATQQPTVRLIQIAAGILARAGREADAQRLLDDNLRSQDDLALVVSDEGRRRLLTTQPVSAAVEGIAEAELALAAALRGQGAPEFSLLLTRLAMRLRPGFAPAMLLAADALTQENQNAAALRLIDEVPESDPLAPAAALRRAALQERLGQADDAAATLRRLAETRPAAWQPLARLGDLERGRSRWAESVAAYDGAIAKLTQVGAQDWPLFYARGIAQERAGRWDRAEADFRHALELSPEQPYVLNYLGYTWVDQGQNLAEARSMLERAVAARPTDGNIADSLGWALFKLGDIPGAVRWLERAVELESRSSVINDHLGDAYFVAGRRHEAEFQWRRALSLGPEEGDGPRIEAKLRDGLPADALPHPRN
ncbi:MAG TPA: tetratricopeptide repeat protein [Roseomonas sp.]|jgi:tetratricopeptide (TPR) repeat protein